jgi:ABC-type branched-subunit amino acid transport system ATPase component
MWLMGQKSLKSFNVKFFRGIRDLSLESLGQINLLVGVNNSGKTSVLEALSIYCHPLDIGVWLNTAQQREQEFRIARTPPLNSLQWLFTHDRTMATDELKTGSIYITSSGSYTVKAMRARYEAIEGMNIAEGHQLPMTFDGTPDRSDNEHMNEEDDFSEVQKGLDLIIELETHPSDTLWPTETTSNLYPTETITEHYSLWENERLLRFPGRKKPSLLTSTVTPVSHRSGFNQLRLLSEARFHDLKDDVLVLLRQMDSNISDIEILSSPGSFSHFNIYIQHNLLGLAPLSTFGDGVRRLLHIALKLAAVKGGILMIDELESTIHTEALQNSFRLLIQWCKEMNIQLFATTHSLEAVDALIEVTTIESDLVLYRIEPKSGQTRVIRHPWDRLKRLREDLGQEVRW